MADLRVMKVQILGAEVRYPVQEKRDLLVNHFGTCNSADLSFVDKFPTLCAQNKWEYPPGCHNSISKTRKGCYICVSVKGYSYIKTVRRN